MFDQTFVEETQGTRKKYTVMLSLLLQTMGLCVLILIPLIYTEVLTPTQLRSLLFVPQPPPPPPPPILVKTTVARVNRVFNAGKLIAPTVIPRQISPIQESMAAPDIGIPGGLDYGNGPLPGISTANGITSVPAPPAPPLESKRPSVLRVGGNVAEANLVYKVQPSYPPLAKSAHVSGSVEFTATISKEGTIENLQLVHGHPLLVQAAKSAVLQWRYRPTMLNGQPVEVVTDIVVNFILGQ